MANVADLPIVADRYAACVRTVRIRGLDLTGVPMRAQVRLYGDTPGAALVDLQNVSNANAEGLRIVSIEQESPGLFITTIALLINESTMEGLPYAGELGDATALRWDWQITLGGRKQRIAKGAFYITGDGVTGADAAPASRAAGFGDQRSYAGMTHSATLQFGDEHISVSIDGPEYLAPMMARATDAAASAEGAAATSGANASRAELASSGATAAARLFATTAAGLAATAEGGFFTVVGDNASTYAILYQKASGAAVEKSRYVSKAAYEGSAGAQQIGFRADAVGAVDRKVADALQDTVSVFAFGAKCDAEKVSGVWTGTDDTAAIQAAMDHAESMGGGVVTFPRGRVRIEGTLVARSGVTLRGVNALATVLVKTGGGHIIHKLDEEIGRDIAIFDLGFDCNGVDAGIYVQYVEHFRCSRLRFSNMPYWGIVVGTSNGADTQIRNTDIVIEDCRFGECTQTYEHILIFNSQDVQISGCRHVSRDAGQSIGIGFYQLVERATVRDGLFRMHIGSYYSLSCNDIIYDNCRFDRCVTPLQGANVSDNGTFGFSRVRGLTVTKPRVSACDGPVQIGAVSGWSLDTVLAQANDSVAVVIDKGNPSSQFSWPGALSQHGRISGGFRSNNLSNGPLIVNPAILIRGVGGDMHLEIDADFWDEGQTPTQGYPIVFDGPYQYAYVKVTGRLAAYRGALSIAAMEGVSFGQGCIVKDASELMGPLPAGWMHRPAKDGFVKPAGPVWRGAFDTTSASAETTRQAVAAIIASLMDAGIIKEVSA